MFAQGWETIQFTQSCVLLGLFKDEERPEK